MQGQGLRISDRYKTLALLNETILSRIYLGVDTLKMKTVVLKTISENSVMFHELRKRIMLEAQIYQTLKGNQNIVTIYSISEFNKRPFIVLEYINGDSLQEIIKHPRRFNIGGKMNLIFQIAEGIGYAHSRGIYHRDLKPSNIMVTPDWIVKILDFGVAKVCGEELCLTKRGEPCFTPSYCSPEQIMNETIDFRTDIFSFGIIAYELITGFHPFRGNQGNLNILNNIRKAVHLEAPNLGKLPIKKGEWNEVFHKVFQGEPKKRYQSTNHFVTQGNRIKNHVAARTLSRYLLLQPAFFLLALIPTLTDCSRLRAISDICLSTARFSGA